ncbi:MAG: GNAT family N-acetyltransferase [Desulfomicrobium sp.]|nr:GNAT family N-acetyltransferase [Desulfomicrobium sp.]
MPYSFRSARILARPVTGLDTPEVEAVYGGNRELLLLLDRDNDPSALARRFVEGRNLPPKGRPSRLHNLLLLEALSQDVMGILGLYAGYPKADVAYIGELFLCSRFQGVGLGREAYLGLEAVLRQGPMFRVRVGVGLRNWNALRFWIRLGFSQITGMSGDRLFGSGRYAFLEMQKNL